MKKALGFVVAWLALIPAAHANTYIFSLSTQQLLNLAGVSSNGAYYALFLQPQGLGSYSYAYESATIPAGDDGWTSTTDTAATLNAAAGAPIFGSSDWMQFSINYSLNGATVVTKDANGSTDYVGQSYTNTSGSATPPVAWDTTSVTINHLMGASGNTVGVFFFELTVPGSTTTTLNTNFDLIASYLTPLGGGLFKDNLGQSLSFSLTGDTIPEPATALLMLGGLAGLIAAKKKMSRSAAK